MALDAGTVKGKLSLDTTEFNEGFKEAHTHAESEGGHIREVLESIAEVASEVAGPAFAQMGQQFQSAIAGFSEGPAIGALNVMGILAGHVREAVFGTADAMHHLGLEAQKLQVSPEFLGRLGAVGKMVDLPLDTISRGFTLLLQRVGDAEEGNKEAADSFAELGLSVQQAAELSKDPEKLWGEVQARLQGMTDAAGRASAAHHVLGRAGKDLVPIFQMSREEYERNADTMERLEGVSDKTSVAMADDFHRLQVEVSAAMEGIERETAKPVLQFFAAHMKEIEPELQALSEGAVVHLKDSWKALYQTIDAFKDDKNLPGPLLAMKEMLDHLTNGFKELHKDLEQLGKGLADENHLGDGPKSTMRQIGDDLRLQAQGKAEGPVNGVTALPRHVYSDSQGGGGPLTGLENLLYHLSLGHAGIDPDVSRARQKENYEQEFRERQQQEAADKAKAAGVSMNTLNTSLADLTDRIRATTDSIGSRGDLQQGGVATSFDGHSNGGGSSVRNGGGGQSVNVAVSFDDTHSTGQLAQQIAAKLMPQMRQMQQRRAENAAGEAAVAMARMSMGGEA